MDGKEAKVFLIKLGSVLPDEEFLALTKGVLEMNESKAEEVLRKIEDRLVNTSGVTLVKQSQQQR